MLLRLFIHLVTISNWQPHKDGTKRTSHFFSMQRSQANSEGFDTAILIWHHHYLYMQMGDHIELLTKNGMYARLTKRQADAVAWYATNCRWCSCACFSAKMLTFFFTEWCALVAVWRWITAFSLITSFTICNSISPEKKSSEIFLNEELSI